MRWSVFKLGGQVQQPFTILFASLAINAAIITVGFKKPVVKEALYFKHVQHLMEALIVSNVVIIINLMFILWKLTKNKLQKFVK